MSVAGTYRVRVKTPLGVQEGRLMMLVEGDLLKGKIMSSAGNFEIKDGKVRGNAVKFETRIKTPLGLQKVTVTGTVEGNRFSGVAKLAIGSAEINGIRE